MSATPGQPGPEPGASPGSAPGAAPPPAPGLLAELRRRGVVRAVVAYGLFAFATLQVAEPVLHALKLPDSWLTGLVALLGLGFPLTAALSWAFDLTRRGIVRTPEPEAAGPGEAGRTHSLRLAMAGVTVIAAGLGALLSWLALRPPAPVADADGRVSVAVADFANQTGEPALDALSGLLITSLEQSQRLKVLTRGRMFDLLRQAGHGKVERIDESAAREVGLKAGVRALLLASVQRLGGAYVVELRGLDPQRDHYLFTLREQAGDQAGLLPLIDRLSEQTRLRLRERIAEVQGSDIRVAQAITPNLEAYRHYFKGKEHAARTETAQATAAFRRALELEPGFTLATYELAWQSFYFGGPGIWGVRDAARGSARLPPKEAGLVRGLDDLLAGNFVEGRQAVESLARRFPDDSDVGYLAAEFAMWSGDNEGALPHYERTLRLTPESEMLHLEYIGTLAYLGRTAEGLAAAEAHARRHPNRKAGWVVGLAKSVAGDRKGALEALRGCDPANLMACAHLAQLLAAEGRLSEGLAAPPNPDPLWEMSRTWALAYAGRRREAAAIWERAVRHPGMEPRLVQQWRSVGLAGAGDLAGARRALDASGLVNGLVMWAVAELRDERALEKLAAVGESTYVGRFATAMLAWIRGDRQGALAGLRVLDRPAGGFVPHYHGMLAAELGLHVEAVEALGRMEGPVLGGADGPLMGWLEARGRLIRARSLDALGRRAEARAAVERQLFLYREADPDLPLLAEAKAVCKQVGCRAP